MIGFLTKEQKKELLLELRKEDKRRYADRIRVILLLDKGWMYAKIAEALFIDEGTIANYRKRYKEGGLEGLIIDEYKGKRSFLSAEEQKILEDFLQSQICLSTREIIHFIEKRFKISYSVSGVTDLLHRNGFTYKKAKSVPGKADKKKQEEFIKLYRKISGKGKNYFADSTHPYHNPIISYGWIKKGQDFNILSNTGRYHLNINGAVEIKNFEVITQNCEMVNALSMCDLLKEIRNKNKYSKNKIYLVMDNASYNRSRSVTELAKKIENKIGLSSTLFPQPKFNRAIVEIF